MVMVKIPFFDEKPVKAAGFTKSGFSKLLNEFISGAVSTSPVILLYDSPITGHVTTTLLLGFRLASEM